MVVKKFPGWVFCAAVMTAAPMGEAIAQLGTPGDVARGITVTSRPRPDFDPLGVRLGGFKLNGSVDIGAGWDSNLFGRKNNAVSDGFLDSQVNLNLSSDWTTHAFGASVSGAARQYFENNSQNWEDWSAGGFGRYDFSANTSVEASYRHFREHLEIDSIDVQTAGLSRPVQYESDQFQLTGTTRFNRVGVLATGLYRTFRYEDTSAGGVRNQLSQNDFDTAIGALGTSYLLAPGRNVNVVVRVQDIQYLDSIARERDSFTWEALAGFDYDFDGVWQARIAVGWRQREYSGANIKSLEGPAFEGQLTWVPTRLTTVRFTVARTIEESIRLDAVSFQRTRAGITLDHEYLRNVILTADLQADRREYESPDETATDALLTLSARYLLNRNMTLIGSYAYSHRLESSGGLEEYSRNLFLLRMRFAL
jgi:hypothetical protein